MFLRPFKVGDVVTAGGVTGRVDSIGLFGTTINTPDTVLTIVGNNKIFSDTIQNYAANPYRRVDLTATISNAVDVLQFTPAGPLLCVRPFCSNAHYWQVYFDHEPADSRDVRGGRLPRPDAVLLGERRLDDTA